MRAHQLDSNNVIINTIEVSSLNFIPNLVDASVGGSIGDSIVNDVVIKNITSITATIPSEVTMRQARAQLIVKGKFALVDDYIKNMTGTAGDLARNEWEYSGRVERNRGLVAALRPLLGLSESEMDTWFIEASNL